MLQRTYEDQVCSVARTLEILGERWTLLIVRDCLLGLRRFDEFQESLGVARNILTDRLRRLVDAGVLDRVEYQQRPQRFEYHLTATGRELGVPIVALMHWGDKHLSGGAGAPRLTRHHGCGGNVHVHLVCGRCGNRVPGSQLEVLPGPGLRAVEDLPPRAIRAQPAER
jgi:DNA-binding HxlR family transcriptional regulator